jgi:high-affinity iron transporter
LEAAIIVSVLLALAEQLVSAKEYGLDTVGTTSTDEQVYERTTNEKKLLRKLRVQIFAGAAVGLLVALAM